uniref:Uncharacterized protein n=1 Tax=Phormidium sp. KS TaxID=654446 RepID=A0A3G9CKZ4_9CYAN|nr:hypothetical protein [Phormidium sp. KS]
MKATANRLFSTPAALISKLVGLLLIVSFLIDAITLVIPSTPPFSPLDRGWQLNVTTQLVERGFIPMLGMALLFAGSWMDSLQDSSQEGKLWQLVKLGALILSGLLGLGFLLIAPLHINNVRLASNQTLEQIQQQASQAEGQLESPGLKTQLSQQQSQVKTQLTDLLKDDQKLNQTLQSDQVPQQQKDLLQQFKSDPGKVDEFLNQQLNPDTIVNRRLTQVRERKQQLEKQTKLAALKSQVQIGASSVLLAIAYLIITGSGLRGVLSPQMGARKPSTR